MRISDWSSDVCSSDLRHQRVHPGAWPYRTQLRLLSRLHALRRHYRLGLYRSESDAHAVRPVWRSIRADAPNTWPTPQDRKSVVEGKSGSVSGDLGGRRIIKKKTDKQKIVKK